MPSAVRPGSEPSPGLGSRAPALAAVPVVAAALVFVPITRNFFHQDDFLALYDLANTGCGPFLVHPHGGHLLIVRNALLALTHWAFGMQPAPYFWMVLATHLVNVLLLFRVIHLFAGSALLACVGATLWGTAPSHEGSLGWYAAYGHVLVGTLLLLLLARIGSRASASARVPASELGLWATLLLLAGMTFGVGLALAAVGPVAVALLLPFRQTGLRGLLILATVPIVLAAVYATVLWVSLLPTGAPGEFLRGLIELWTDWRPVLRMWWHLAAYGIAGLLLGVFDVPATYPTWTSRALAIAFSAGLGLLLLRSPAAVRRRAAALVLLAVAAYGSIAIGRGAVYAAHVPDIGAVVTVPRYHYVASIPLAIVVSLVLEPLCAWTAGRTALGAWLLVQLGSLVVLRPAIAHHDQDRAATLDALARIRAEIARTPAGEEVVIENQPFAPAVVLRARFPGWAGLFLLSHPTDVVDGRRVRFSMPASQIGQFTAGGGRIATLLVPDGAPRVAEE